MLYRTPTRRISVSLECVSVTWTTTDPNIPPSLTQLMQRRLSLFRSAVPRAAVAALTALVLAACKGDDGPKPPATIVAISGAASTGVVGEFASDPLSVKVADASGAPVGGVVVTFTVAEGGGSVSPSIDTTDNSGLAQTRWRLGGTAGQQRVTASIANITTVANFVATAAAGVPAAVALQAGDNQSAVVGAVVAAAPAVIVRDRFNNPVSNTSVVFSVASGGGTISGAGAVTNANGIATVGEWRLGPTVGANRLQALVLSNSVTGNPITFNATATAGAAATLTAQGATAISAVVGSLVTPIPSVRVVDASGNPVANVSVTFVASAGSSVLGGTKPTNASGIASPDGWQLGSVAQSYTLTATVGALTPVVFTAVARPGAAAQVVAAAGDAQSAAVGRTLNIDPAVRLSDALGNAVAGVEVNFEVVSGGGSAFGRRTVTDAAGIATVGGWTLGETAGSNSLRATVTGTGIAGNPVLFTATATAGAPSSVTIGNGNNQTATAGSLLPIAPSVTVRDARGNPSAGVTVTFTAGANSGVVVGGIATTNAAGVAAAASWTLGGTAGTQTLVASVTGLPSVTFSASATSGTASRVVAVSDSSLGGFPVTNFVSPLPSVRVLDANGNPVSGAIVTFVADGGAGTSTLTGSVRTTGTDGIATLGTWRLGSVATLYRLRASVAGLDQLGLEPTFVATGTAAAAAEVIASSTVSQPSVLPSAPVPVVPSVRVLDQYGNGVGGVTVTFTVTSGATGPTASSIASGVQTLDVVTNALGYASVTSWTMGPVAGTRTLTATVVRGGILNNPITFTAIVP